MTSLLTPRGKRRIDTDERIIRAAIHHFGEKGFSTASLTDIAAEAGVSQGLVSQRFESKEKLLEAAFKATPAASFFLDKSTSDLNTALLSIVASLKKEQRTDKWRFAFVVMLYTARDVPESFTALSNALFKETQLSALEKDAQAAGTLAKGDAYRLFSVFYRNALSLIRDCAEASLPLPDDSFFLNVLGLNASSAQATNATSASPQDTTAVSDTAASQNTTALFVEQVRPALRAVEGYISLIKKHAGEEQRVRDYAAKAELIAGEFVRNLDNLK